MRLIPLILALGISAVSAYVLPNNTARASTFHNPVLWEDLADLDLIRVGDAFYYSASTMHYSPGAPILLSYDLVNWEYIGHSVPRLEFGNVDYDLPPSSHAYVRGIWASTLKHRASTGTFYWLGCIDFTKTYIYTAPAVEGPWTQSAVLDHCYYDAGMLVDDDDNIYVAFGSTNIEVAQLTADGLSEVKSQVVYEASLYIEGSRFYKKDGFYYILVTYPPSEEYVLRSSNVFGPYELQPLAVRLSSPIGGGSPHQGGLIDTPNGDWYYMGFSDGYPGGRIPVLAPITWSADGWPSMVLDNFGNWSTTYPYPLPLRPLSPPTGIDTFVHSHSLSAHWEWNHNPDNSAWSIQNGLVLRTTSVTNDLYAARNTLTRRILGPQSSGTILLDIPGMRDGDRSGLSMFRTTSAWIGVQQDGFKREIVMVNGLTMGGPSTTPQSWETTGTGSVAASAPLHGNQVYLRVTVDIRPGGTNSATFSYSTNGLHFVGLGETLALDTDWQFFMGYRYGIFNYATLALGGSVTVKSFEVQRV